LNVIMYRVGDFHCWFRLASYSHKFFIFLNMMLFSVLKWPRLQ